VAAISFTGSVGTGDRIIARAAARRARAQVEMGGKNPLVVMDDADLELATTIALSGAYHSTGQRCTASSRFIMLDRIHDRFVSRLCEKLAGLRVGHALAPDTDVGPVVDGNQLESDVRYIELGAREGARLAHGGRRLERETPGFYLEPALFV